ncbi:tRNA uracil 4-sulfurtransferase ThiI [Defluviitalea phaphyphila]|uniref:tRNA uracil 4-sulfurtransferase ThiI n=1 Tax=Defluviitalea phaphyphila TaxID=1473580 RepID=UPI00072FDE73|nr:tRNA uracil 4-sulfurtransferase ThiI [Defluviitalea phaphyphila]
MKNIYLIKYGEIAIKGKNRYLFENALITNIKRSIKELGNFHIQKDQGRILVEPEENIDSDKIMNRLTKIFGVVGVCLGIKNDNINMETIKETALSHMKSVCENNKYTFKVETKRSDKNFPLNSMEISREVGAYILKNMGEQLKVDVHNPEIRLNIELRNSIYVYSKVVPGPGGMPVGTNGKAMLLLSGGIDSPVAGWMIAKRGVEIGGIYFDSPPYTSERAKQKVIDLAKQIAVYTGKFKLYIVPFTDIQLEIYKKCPHQQLTIIMRRIMMKISEKIAKKENAQALVTGESIGQVASQTIQSLTVTNAAVNLPVFRPLIGFDKEEIVTMAKKINTYETSILPYEDCCTIFVPKHPETKPKLEYILKSEKALDNIQNMIEEAIEKSDGIIIK